MKAHTGLILIGVVAASQFVFAQDRKWFPPRVLFPGELQKVRSTFSLESVKEAQAQRFGSQVHRAPEAIPDPIPFPSDFDPNPPGNVVEEFERDPVELLGIEPIEEDGGDAPLFEVLPELPVQSAPLDLRDLKRRPLTDEEWRHSADKTPADALPRVR